MLQFGYNLSPKGPSGSRGLRMLKLRGVQCFDRRSQKKVVMSWRLYLTGSVPSSLDGIGLTGLSWFSQEWFAAREQACALRQSAGTDVTDSHVLPATCQDVLPPEDDACAVPSSIQNCELKHFFFYTEGVITTPNRQVTSSYMQ